MTGSRFLIVTFVVPVSVLFGIFIGQSYEKANAQASKKSECNIFTVMDRERISIARQYDGDEGKVYAILRRKEEPLKEDPSFRTHERLSIYNQKRNEIFSKADFRIDDFYFSNLTRSGLQLLVETNGGGTDEFLELYDLKNGKFEAIIDSAETQMRGGYFMIPEYRTGMKSRISNHPK